MNSKIVNKTVHTWHFDLSLNKRRRRGRHSLSYLDLASKSRVKLEGHPNDDVGLSQRFLAMDTSTLTVRQKKGLPKDDLHKTPKNQLKTITTKTLVKRQPTFLRVTKPYSFDIIIIVKYKGLKD